MPEIKVDGRPVMEVLHHSLDNITGATIRVAESPSTSEPGMAHLTVVSYNRYNDTTLLVRCSCKGFQAHDHCWHVDALQESLDR